MAPVDRSQSAPPESTAGQPPAVALNVEPVLQAITRLITLVDDVQKNIPCPPEAPRQNDTGQPTGGAGCFGFQSSAASKVSTTRPAPDVGAAPEKSCGSSISCFPGRLAFARKKGAAAPGTNGIVPSVDKSRAGAGPAARDPEVKAATETKTRAVAVMKGAATSGGSQAAVSGTGDCSSAATTSKAVAEENATVVGGAGASSSSTNKIPEVNATTETGAKAAAGKKGTITSGGSRAAVTGTGYGSRAATTSKAVEDEKATVVGGAGASSSSTTKIPEVKTEIDAKAVTSKKGAITSGGSRAAVTGPRDGGRATSASKDVVKAEAAAGATSSIGSQPSLDNNGGNGQQANGPIANGPVDNVELNRNKTTASSIRQRLKHDDLKVYNQAEKLLRDLKFVESELSKLKVLGEKADFPGLKDPAELSRAIETVKGGGSFPTQTFLKELQSLAKKVRDVKNYMPGRSASIEVEHKKGKEPEFDAYDELSSDIKDKIQGMGCCFNEFLEDFDRTFEDLDPQSKLCLLCFSIFPENAVVHKKVLGYWWIGEGLVDPPLPRNKTADPLPGNKTADPLPGNKTANPLPGSQTADPSPGNKPADPLLGNKPAPGNKPADPLLGNKPAPGNKPADPLLGNKPADPLLGNKPADPLLGNKPAPGNKPADPSTRNKPADPSLGSKPADPPCGNKPADMLPGNKTADPLLGIKTADPLPGNQTASHVVQLPSKTADEVLRELCSKGFIKPVLKKLKLFGFEMDPLVRFVVIILAQRLDLFNFDQIGIPTADFSSSHHACLVKNREGNYFSRWDLARDKSSESSNKDRDRSVDRSNGNADLDRLHTLFNVNDPYPDFKVDWFQKLKMLNVLCLGGWQGSRGHHIEVESTDFLKGLKSMKYLRYLSLQGISRINELPDSLCALTNLKILDLNACHHLESLPNKLEQFRNLTHLDISECYLLDHIPKGLGQLKELLVLKGFVIGGMGNDKETCTLNDLAGLKKLRKLSITSSRENFPLDHEVKVLHDFQYLEKLTIVWGGQSSKVTENEAKPVRPGYSANSMEKEKVPPKGNTAEMEVGKAKPAEDKKVSFAKHKEKEKDVSGEPKKGDGEIIAGKMEEPKGKGIVQEQGKETRTENKKEGKEYGSEQQEVKGSSGTPKKADKGKGLESRVTFAGDAAEQGNASSKSPRVMPSQQSALPATGPKLTSRPSMGKTLARALSLAPSTTAPAPVVNPKLEKLELQCCPQTKAPSWMLGQLKPSKKLYIRGGNLRSLRDGQGEKWSVKILCLKYLADLEMDWRELRELFPDLVFLEKSRCPKLTFFPCNSSGVWINSKAGLSDKGKKDLEEVRKDLSWSFLT